MTTKINKPKAEDIESEAEEVETDGSETQPDALEELFGATAEEDAPAAEEDAGDDAEAGTDGGSSEEKGDQGKPETAKPDDSQKSEPYAKIGAMEFKTKEDLVAFTNSQTGYNSFITGGLKKLHPELFKSDGSIDNKKLTELGTSKPKVEAAAETVAEMAEKGDDMTKEDEQELEKAKAILRPLGVVFSDDPVFQQMKSNVDKQQVETISQARSVVETFVAGHPLVNDHRDALADYMIKNEIEDIAKAWKGYKALNDVEEAETEHLQTKDGDRPRNASADLNIPVVVKKSTGAKPAPSAGSEDSFFDSLVGLKGMQ